MFININIAWKVSHYPDLMQSLFYYACACIYPCKIFDTIIFVFQNMAKTNAQRQKEWREKTKK